MLEALRALRARKLAHQAEHFAIIEEMIRLHDECGVSDSIIASFFDVTKQSVQRQRKYWSTDE